MAAIGTVLELLDSGAHVVAMDDLYGGSYRILERVRKRSAGLQATFVDLSKTENLEAAIRPNTRMLWVESPTNPLLKLVDLEAVAAIARKRGIDLGVRQHLRLAVGAAAARARLRHRGALDHQVSQRPLRCHRRRRRSQG